MQDCNSCEIMPVPPPTFPSATVPPRALSSASKACSSLTWNPLMSLRYPSQVSATTGSDQGWLPWPRLTHQAMTASRTVPTLWVLVIITGPSIRPDSSTQVVPVISPLPFRENHPAKTRSKADRWPRGKRAVTPVRTGPRPTWSFPSPTTMVLWPTATPATSVMAFSGPGLPSKGTPRSRARGLACAQTTAGTIRKKTRIQVSKWPWCFFIVVSPNGFLRGVSWRFGWLRLGGGLARPPPPRRFVAGLQQWRGRTGGGGRGWGGGSAGARACPPPPRRVVSLQGFSNGGQDLGAVAGLGRIDQVLEPGPVGQTVGVREVPFELEQGSIGAGQSGAVSFGVAQPAARAGVEARGGPAQPPRFRLQGRQVAGKEFRGRFRPQLFHVGVERLGLRPRVERQQVGVRQPQRHHAPQPGHGGVEAETGVAEARHPDVPVIDGVVDAVGTVEQHIE